MHVGVISVAKANGSAAFGCRFIASSGGGQWSSHSGAIYWSEHATTRRFGNRDFYVIL